MQIDNLAARVMSDTCQNQYRHVEEESIKPFLFIAYKKEKW